MNKLAPKNDEYSAFARIAAESVGVLLKFSKTGNWIAGSTEENMDHATMVADVANLAIGWRKWIDGKIVDSNIGYVRDNFTPKERAELDVGDLTPWPKNSRGELTDPWQFGYYLQLTAAENSELYTWSATSFGAKRAISDLTRYYMRFRANPIVKLDANSYRHREYGTIFTPVLKIIGSVPEDPGLTGPAKEQALPAPKPSPSSCESEPFGGPESIDDEIPF